MAVDIKVVEEKISKGQTLSAEEIREVMSMPPEGNSNILPADDIKDEDFHDEIDQDLAAKKAAEDKAAADKKAAEEKAAAEKKAAEAKTEDPMVKINAELSKPEGKEDLNGLTEREKAYFWEMRRDRKRAQKAEEERDLLRLEKAKEKQAKEAAEAKALEDIDPLKDRADDEPLTVKDLKLMKELEKKRMTPKDTQSARPAFDPNSPVILGALKAQDELARKEIGIDYDETVECAEDIISKNPEYLEKIGKALLAGENVAKLTYTLIKGDPEFTKALPAAKARLKAAGKKTSDDVQKPAEKTAEEKAKEEAALAAQKKLEENQNKKKTSAHVDGDAGQTAGLGEYTIDQLLGMSDRDFAKVPKKIRESFLKQVGV